MSTEPERRLRLGVLGPVSAWDPEGRPFEVPGGRARTLLAALALAEGGLSTAAAIDEVWGEGQPRNARAALQTLVSRVRSSGFGDALASDPGGYRLDRARITIDLDEAETHAATAGAALDRGEAATALGTAERGLALWRGEPGDDVSNDGLGDALAGRSRRLRTALALAHARGALAVGDAASAVRDARVLVGADPFDEDALLLLLEALDAAGRRTEALRAFADYRERLRDELGADPAPALAEAHAWLLRAEERPPSRPRRVGVRASATPLLGREADVRRVERALAESRLVTILGAGGLGKTRLAQEVAGRSRSPAVVVVELAGVRDGADVALALAGALGVREATSGRMSVNDPIVLVDVRERIRSALEERATLLVIDNCEHVVADAARWVDDLLASVPGLRVLTTSRAPLAIAAETVLPLAPLSSAGDGPAVELFLQRARAARPGAALDPAAVRRLCDRLDGLPLAIELAAARIRSMPLEEIERRLGNRFALLTSGERTAPERHRTLLAVIDWSWNLLGGDERALLRRFSRFTGGFGAHAAARVGGLDGDDDVTDALEGLVTQSLVTASESPETGDIRYRMLETVREFGARKLVEAGEEERVEAAMAAWAESFAVRMLNELDSTGPAGYHRVADEQDNLVEVLRRAVEAGRSTTAITVFAVLSLFWMLSGRQSELVGLLPLVQRPLRRFVPDAGNRDATMLALAVCSFELMFGQRRRGLVALGRLRRMARREPAADPQIRLLSTILLAGAAGFEELVQSARGLREDPDPRAAAMANLLCGQFEENSGLLDDAIASVERGRELGLAAGSLWLPMTSAMTLTEFHSQAGRPSEALTWCAVAREGQSLLQPNGPTFGLQLEWLEAMARISTGDPEAAEDHLDRLLRQESDDPDFDALDRRGIVRSARAEIALAAGRVEEGLAGYRDAVTGYGTGSSRRPPWELLIRSACLAAHAVAGVPIPAGRTFAPWRLATSLRVLRRLRGGLVDLPITGALVRGLGVWLALAGEGGPEAARLGLEAAILSGRTGGRQDLPALRVEPLVSACTKRFGEAEVGAGLEAAAPLDPLEALSRATDLLACPAARTALGAA